MNGSEEITFSKERETFRNLSVFFLQAKRSKIYDLALVFSEGVLPRSS